MYVQLNVSKNKSYMICRNITIILTTSLSPLCSQFFSTKHTVQSCQGEVWWLISRRSTVWMPTERQHLPWHTGPGTDRAGLMSLKKQLSSLMKFNSARLLPEGPLTLILVYFHGKAPFHTAGVCLQSSSSAHTTPSGQSHPPSTASLRPEIHKCFSPIHGTNSRSHWQEM